MLTSPGVTTAPCRSSAGPGGSPSPSSATSPAFDPQPAALVLRGLCVHRHDVGPREDHGLEPYSSRDGDPDSAKPFRGAVAEGGASGGDPDPGRDRSDGRAEFRPRAAVGRAEPERGARAARVGALGGVAPARLGAHLCRGDDAGARIAPAFARRGVPHRRLAPDPQQGDDRWEPGDGLSGRRRGAAAPRGGRRDRMRLGARLPPGGARRVRHRGEANRPRAGRADRGRLGPGRPGCRRPS